MVPTVRVKLILGMQTQDKLQSVNKKKKKASKETKI